MRTWLYDKSKAVFLLTLAIYVLIWATVSYIGVYVTYVAGPILFFSGLIWWATRPRNTETIGIKPLPPQPDWLRDMEAEQKALMAELNDK